MSLTTVIDVGNFSTKFAYKKGKDVKVSSFSSVIHPYKELEDPKDMTRFSFNNLDYYVGDGVHNFYLGKEDSMYFGNIKKGHHEAQIRLVAALYNIYQQTGEKSFNLIITSPYDSMEKDKQYFVKNFEGKKYAYVDDQPFEFEIKKIIIAAEGLGAFNYSQSPNVAIVDAGSMTTNVLYMINGSISKEDSVTMNGGTNNLNLFQIANNFVKACPHVEYDYPILCTGGKADELKQALERLGFENVSSVSLKDHPSFYANSIGILLKFGERFEAMFA
jgi:plasmid segregation protein ParM